MSLQIIIGRSGAGKSTAVYEKIIQESRENPKRSYFIIVPDQFTMQTQMDIVKMTACGGIMNIDVLSFSRLAHRIFEETGGNRKPVLDDTGKSLILRKIAADLCDKTPVIGANLDKQGYIHEVKSAISEFMQYSIGKEELQQLIDYAKPKGSLYYKLQDLAILYEGFTSYIKENYITTEESMDILSNELYHSKLIQDSVVVFDGFTGFTPIQNKVIGTLMELCRQVVMTLTIDEKSLYSQVSEQDLFLLSKKTYYNMIKIAGDKGVPIEKLISLQGSPTRRFSNREELAFLEQELFSYPILPYRGKREECISLCRSQDIHDEVRNICKEIRNLLISTGCCYRNIAVITGDLASYESEIEEEFSKYNIPFFMDQTKGILLNPFTQYIASVLELFELNFSYESVFRYLRSGLVDFSKEETDILENYILEMGIRGKTGWTRTFAGRTKEMKKNDTALNELAYLNKLRERFVMQLSPMINFTKHTETTVRNYIEQLYAVIIYAQISNKLDALSSAFEAGGDYTRAKEYDQVYGLIMNLFDQIIDLIGEEKMSIADFSDILDAGFNEIEVGSIPQSVDRVIVGDMERTRLKPVSYLFFIGLNDGFIPKNGTKSGIISDMEREFLATGKMELAPSKRQQMYIQKFYLYLNMTKPSEKLFLSYSALKSDGTVMRPSYLVSIIEKMFPEVRKQSGIVFSLMLSNTYELKDQFCILLRRYADGSISTEENTFFMQLLSALSTEEETREFVFQKISQAFSSVEKKSIQQMVAGALYGQTLATSISRMEQYASCAYSFFLQYGLSLKERELYGLKSRDMGTIFHGVLEQFGEKLNEKNLTWFDFPEELAQEMVSEALLRVSTDYSDAILFDNAQNRYILKRMGQTLTTAVNTISYQLRKGFFKPEAFEVSFSVQETLDDINVALNEQEKMKLSGRIDRMDIYEDEEHVYVKVVDYKSGDKDFSLAAFYHGLQLQLVVYLNEAIEMTEREHPGKETVPAALLYYHVNDPLIEGTEEMSEEAINQKIKQSLRMKGIVNSDINVINKLDASQTQQSDCIPVDYKTDGSFKRNASVMEPKNLKLISDFASYKLKETAKRIYKGEIPVNPIVQGNINSCTYCQYKGVCGFDEHENGSRMRVMENDDETELLEKMKQEMINCEKGEV